MWIRAGPPLLPPGGKGDPVVDPDDYSDREYMTTRQCAEFLGCCRASIYRWVNGVGVSEPLPVARLSRNKLVFEAARVRAWLDRLGGFPSWEEVESEEEAPSK